MNMKCFLLKFEHALLYPCRPIRRIKTEVTTAAFGTQSKKNINDFFMLQVGSKII